MDDDNSDESVDEQFFILVVDNVKLMDYVDEEDVVFLVFGVFIFGVFVVGGVILVFNL